MGKDEDAAAIIILGALGIAFLASILGKKKCKLCGNENSNSDTRCKYCGGYL